MSHHFPSRRFLVVPLLIALVGCASHFERIEPVRSAFYSGRLDEAQKLLESRDLRLRNGDVKQLDRAMIELASGRPASSEQILRTVRDRFEKFEERSLAEEGVSLLTDDNVKAYPGEDYERVLVRVFLTLANLMRDGGDAAAYALQINEEQQQIIDQAQERHKDDAEAVLAYKQVPLGPYVRAMLDEESPLTLHDASRARAQVVEWAPYFRDGKSDLQRVQYEAPMPPGHGALYVFALVGHGPVKEPVAEIPTQVSLLIADRIISSMSNRGLPPTLAPVWVPHMKSFSTATTVRVEIGGRPVGQTATLMDIGEMAENQHAANYPHIIAQAVARRVLKKAVIYGVKEGIDAEHDSVSSILLDVAGVAWEAAETADTRCWSLLPDKIQVLRVELPTGEHELALRASCHGGVLSRATQTKIPIRDGRNTYALAIYPNSELVGQIVVSGQQQ